MALLGPLLHLAAFAADPTPPEPARRPEGASLRVVIFPEAQEYCAVALTGAAAVSGLTDDGGRITFEKLAAGAVQVSVRCPGREPVAIDGVWLVDDRLCEIGVTPISQGAAETARVWMNRLGPKDVLTWIFPSVLPFGLPSGPPRNDGCEPPEATSAPPRPRDDP